jgi:hypothetical protein
MPDFLTGLPDRLGRDENLTSGELRFWARMANRAAIEMRRPLVAIAMDPATEDFHEHFPEVARVRIGFQPPRTQEVSRLQNKLAQNVANELARKYFALTGKEPNVPIDCIDGRPYGQFWNFVREIFDLLGIRRHALHCARIATPRLRKAPRSV